MNHIINPFCHCRYRLRGFFAMLLILAGTHLSADDSIDEIIVTAEFRDTALLDIATSLSVVDADVIAAREARHLEQLLNILPNVNFSSGASRGRFIQIRGIGERSQFIQPLNPSVGILIDGIDLSGVAGAATTMDTKQVEILRGPQGTLYGANALAGLINLRSNQPGDRAANKLLLATGSYNTNTVSAAMGGQLNPELDYRVALQKHSSDGYIENDFLDREDTDNIDELSLRTIFHWSPDEKLKIKLSLFHVDTDNGYDGFSLDNTRMTLSDEPGHDRQRSSAVALSGDWQATERFDVQTLFSTVDSDMEYGYDEDWAFPEICSGLPCDGWAYSSKDNYLRDSDNRVIDIKLVSSQPIEFLTAQLDWVAGVYARDQDEQLLRQYTYNTRDFGSDFDTSNRAVYGQFELSLTDRTTLVTGLRFERRDAGYNDSDGVAHRVDENLVGGRLAVQYKPDQSSMIYALLSRGYKAGGVNSDPALAPEDRDFDTETMWNVELGIKGSWLNDQLQAQMSAFHQQRRDIQIKQSLVQSRDDSNASDFIDYFGNSAEGYNRGLEVEFDWTIAENLMVFGSLGLLSSEYDTPLSETLDAREQAHAPSYQFALGSLVRLNDSLSWQMLVEGKDAFYLSSSHDERSQSYRLLNTRLTYDVGQWQLSLWGRNLTDEEVIVRGFGGFGNDPRKFYETEPYYQLGEPRVFGISGTYQFN